MVNNQCCVWGVETLVKCRREKQTHSRYRQIDRQHPFPRFQGRTCVLCTVATCDTRTEKNKTAAIVLCLAVNCIAYPGKLSDDQFHPLHQ